MTVIESKTNSIQASGSKVFDFLSDMNNFGKLMPQQVTNWKCTTNQCSFTINGMADLNMVISEKNPNSFIKYSAEGKNPFDYFLETKITSTGANTASAQIVFHADLNAMLKMLASRPLENFVNLLVDKLKEHMEQ